MRRCKCSRPESSIDVAARFSFPSGPTWYHLELDLRGRFEGPAPGTRKSSPPAHPSCYDLCSPWGGGRVIHRCYVTTLQRFSPLPLPLPLALALIGGAFLIASSCGAAPISRTTTMALPGWTREPVHDGSWDHSAPVETSLGIVASSLDLDDLEVLDLTDLTGWRTRLVTCRARAADTWCRVQEVGDNLDHGFAPGLCLEITSSLANQHSHTTIRLE